MRHESSEAPLAEPLVVDILKAHGARNDVLLVDGAPGSCGLEDPQAVADFVRAACDRDNLISGADGVYFVDRSRSPASALYFNADGSPAEYCGNGLRCVGRFLLEREGRTSTQVVSGEVAFEVTSLPMSKGGVHNVAVRSTSPVSVSASSDASLVSEVSGSDVKILKVLAPNPHIIHLVDRYDEGLLDRLATRFSNEAAFRGGVNTSVVMRASEDPKDFFVRTHERGVGLTPSCASGAVAATAALVTWGLAPSEEEIFVRNVGGPLNVRVDAVAGGLVPTQSGNATYVLHGQIVRDESGTWSVGRDFTPVDSELQSVDSLWWENANHLTGLGVREARTATDRRGLTSEHLLAR